MTQYKDFQGKTLDEAIQEACGYFGVPREKLEIEIVSDAKSGIFGLVGAKKASIRAARVQMDTVSSLLDGVGEESAPGGKKQSPKASLSSKAGNAGKQDRRQGISQESKAARASSTEQDKEPAEAASAKSPLPPRTGSEKNAPAQESRQEKRAKSSAPSGTGKHSERRPAPREVGHDKVRAASQERSRDRQQSPSPQDAAISFPSLEGGAESGREDLPDFDLANCNREDLARKVEDAVLRLVEPIVGQVPCTVEISSDRVRVALDCGDASGLLVGREGQTLAAVQYLASRIIARQIGGSLRLHIDAGKYRERQDDRLKELALNLAARVKKTRKPQTTRPLSAYQRRIVHLALEHDLEVTTRSKGEGAQRRVMVSLGKKGEAHGGKNGPESSPLEGADVEDAAPSSPSHTAHAQDNTDKN